MWYWYAKDARNAVKVEKCLRGIIPMYLRVIAPACLWSTQLPHELESVITWVPMVSKSFRETKSKYGWSMPSWSRSWRKYDFSGGMVVGFGWRSDWSDSTENVHRFPGISTFNCSVLTVVLWRVNIGLTGNSAGEVIVIAGNFCLVVNKVVFSGDVFPFEGLSVSGMVCKSCIVNGGTGNGCISMDCTGNDWLSKDFTGNGCRVSIG